MKLSIIIPIYNTERFLQKCLQSVIKQTFTDYEVILVDDGSTDNSGIICDDYATRDKRFYIIHSSNKGPASAKNIGLAQAKGDFVAFIDSDDELNQNMFESMIDLAERKDVDVVCCSYLQVDEDGNISHNTYSNKEYVFSQEEGLKHLLDKNLIYSQCWTKIYRKSLLDSRHIQFIEGLKTEEDFLFNLNVFLYSSGIAVKDSAYYIYTYRAGSLSREYYKEHLLTFLNNMSYRLQITDKKVRELFPFLKEASIIHCMKYYNLMIGRVATVDRTKGREYVKEAHNYLKKNGLLLLHNHNICGFSLLGALLCLLLPSTIYLKYRSYK